MDTQNYTADDLMKMTAEERQAALDDLDEVCAKAEKERQEWFDKVTTAVNHLLTRVDELAAELASLKTGIK